MSFRSEAALAISPQDSTSPEDAMRNAHRNALRAVLRIAKADPCALVEESMPDPFALALGTASPGCALTEGLWLVATCNNRPYAFRLYHRRPGAAEFEPARDASGKHLTVFPEGQLPLWWNQGEPVPNEPGLPDDLLRARWAPEIFELEGRLVLFYTARDRQGVLRSAYASSPSMRGPWTDHGPLEVNPRVRSLRPEYPGGAGGPDPELGTIDGTVVQWRDAGAERPRYAFVCKVDGNALRWSDPQTGALRAAPTPLVAREFAFQRDGTLTFVGAPNTLLTDGPHHDGLIEGQFFVQENGTLYVLYSAGYFGNHQYRTYIGKVDDVLHGKVHSERLLIDSRSPVLSGRWNGPGHPSLEKIVDGLYALYLHAWPSGTDYENNGEQRRALRFHLAFRDEEGRPCEPFVVESLGRGMSTE